MKRPCGKFMLSLTGKDSHQVDIDAGQGSFTIATKESKRKADAYIDADTPVLWNAFDGLEVPSGGNWPRLIDYMGNDTSFIQWTEYRKTEDFYWEMLSPASVDFSKTKILRLLVNNNGFPLDINLDSPYLRDIFLKGDPHKINIQSAVGIKKVYFTISTEQDSLQPVTLPYFLAFETIESIHVGTPVIGQPFDCASLLPYKYLKRISLQGNLCNFEALEQFSQIIDLSVRYCPDMNGFPPLSTWNNLECFIAWNVEEITGKRLRQELRTLLKVRPFDCAQVSNLRKKIWFSTEFNVPFTNWEGKNGKAAMKIYKATLKAIKKAKDEQEVKALLVTLIETINNLPDIETVEREDTFEAIHQLAASAPFSIEENKVQQWFDEARIF